MKVTNIAEAKATLSKLLSVLAADPRLSPRARQAIGDGGDEVYVSAASAWEIAIKRALGTLRAPHDLAEVPPLYRFRPLAIDVGHALEVEHPPPHHADPCDRPLIAQATIERLTLMTRDRRIALYHVRTIEA
jgi:PIN domain nuclease of toxin-antitoxin system